MNVLDELEAVNTVELSNASIPVHVLADFLNIVLLLPVLQENGPLRVEQHTLTIHLHQLERRWCGIGSWLTFWSEATLCRFYDVNHLHECVSLSNEDQETLVLIQNDGLHLYLHGILTQLLYALILSALHSVLKN